MLAIFLEGWSVADCKHHLPKLRNIRLTRHASIRKYRRILQYDTIHFGKGLAWNLEDIELHNSAKLTLGGSRKATINVV